mmetsp:Transcript_138805/g.431799  ORF Transcript_138805/g.431799 Transcript_138805/m.431799 type:complete len:217 (+) Transcript_138805:918-1568(+)
MSSSQIRRPSGSAAAAASAAASAALTIVGSEKSAGRWPKRVPPLNACPSIEAWSYCSLAAWLPSPVSSEIAVSASPADTSCEAGSPDEPMAAAAAAATEGSLSAVPPVPLWVWEFAKLCRHCASSSTAPMSTWKKTVSARKSTCPVSPGSRCRQRAARSHLDSSAARSSASGADDRGGRSTPKCFRKSSSVVHVSTSSPPVARSKATLICRSSICQ